MKTDTPSQASVQTYTLAHLIDELTVDAERAHEAYRSGIPRGPRLGLPTVDDILGGFLAPGLHLLQSAPGAGKTALSLQIAAECGYPALYVTAEMPPKQLVRRIIARTTRTFLRRLTSGELTGSEFQALIRAAAPKVPYLSIMDGTRGYADPWEHIEPVADALRDRAESTHVLIVVDSLQVWARSARAEKEARDCDEYTLTNAGISALLKVSARLGCPVLAISHRNRAGNRSTNGNQALFAGKGSGDLEYAAESVLDLEPGDAGVNDYVRPVKLGVHKNRHGEVGITTTLQFEGRLQEFREGVNYGN